MKRPVELRIIASVAVLALAAGGIFASSMSTGCTDGATPDCTGDASGSCGLLPNEAGADDDAGNAEGGNTTDSGTDTGTGDTDTGAGDTDAQGNDGGDDAGEAGD
jgi:hypothetical protein